MIHTAFVSVGVTPTQFDEFDQKIVEALLRNGRLGGKDLSVEVGLSEATVSRRCGIYASTGVFRLCGFIDPWQCGCGHVTLVRLGVTGSPHAAAERIAGVSAVHRLSWAAGSNSLLALVACADTTKLPETLDTIASACPNAHHEATDTVVAIHQGHDGTAKPATMSAQLPLRESPRQRNTDLRLVQLLQRDLRMSYTAIANELGNSITLSGEHTKRIFASGAISAIGVIDMALRGMPLTAVISISFTKDATKHARTLAQKLPSNLVFLTDNPEQVVAEVSFAGEGDVFRWMEQARHLGDVRSIRWDPLHAIYKQTYDWAIPGETLPHGA